VENGYCKGEKKKRKNAAAKKDKFMLALITRLNQLGEWEKKKKRGGGVSLVLGPRGKESEEDLRPAQESVTQTRKRKGEGKKEEINC